MANRISRYMEDNNLFAKSQSGFRSHRMTTEQLLRLSEECHTGFKKHQTTAALFLDAEAAFDRCWHSGIRYKLKNNLNLPNRTIRFLSSFLSDRTLIVIHDGCSSHTVHLKAGTPQGSPLSPLIYLIYVNDYPESIQDTCSLSQFADDSAIWTTAYTRAVGTRRLQSALNTLEGWCRRWRVKLNGDKSRFLFITRNRERANENYALHLFNEIIRPVDNAKFLGLDIDSHLSYKKHFDDIRNRSMKRLSVLRVLSYNGTKPNILMKLYKVYIRSMLEYGSIALIAAPKTQMARLQQVQNESIRICLKLPRYISVKLLHDYASINPLENRIRAVGKKILSTMKRHNPHIEALVTNHSAHIDNSLSSPLDIILND